MEYAAPFRCFPPQRSHRGKGKNMDHEQLGMQLLDAVFDEDRAAQRAASHRIDAENSWRGVAHFLAGFAAGQREAHIYRLETGRCLRDDMDTFTALPALTAAA
jgi:hypothetical protein